MEFERIADIKRLNFIINALNSKLAKGAEILDVGCGNGIPRYREYCNIRWSDERAVMDDLAQQLRNSPNEIAYLMIYAGQTSCINEARKRAIRGKNYLVHKHGIPADRILWKDGGYLVEVSIEIWL